MSLNYTTAFTAPISAKITIGQCTAVDKSCIVCVKETAEMYFSHSHLASYPISETFIILRKTKWDPIEYTSVYVMFCIGLKMAE
jgi:hypothetical protein